MQCHLVHLSGPRAGQAKSFDGARITIGRASTCDFQFDPYQDLEVASHHAEILIEDGEFFIHDLDTRGGTYVNGERITKRHSLHHEDFIQFGKHGPEVIFRTGVAGPDPQPLPPKAPQTGELEFISGADAGKLFPVRGDRTTRLGRRADLEISLDPRGDMVVSGNHCSIDFQDDRFVVTDTSRNGTYINGDPVEDRAILRDGDILTLGLGGPRARFRIHPQRRVYPNLGGEFPRLSREPAHAAPAPTYQGGEHQAQTATGQAAPTPSNGLARGDSSRPGRLRRMLRSKVVLGALVLGMLFLAALATILLIQGSPASLQSARKTSSYAEDYAQEIRDAVPFKSAAGHFSAKIPLGWQVRDNGAMLSMESLDKLVNVDYVRDSRLNEASVEHLVRLNSSSVRKLANPRPGSDRLTVYVSKGVGKSRMGVLHQPKGGVPGLALVEASDETFQRIPDDAIGALAIDDFKLQQLAMASPTPAATPAQRSSAAAALSPTTRTLAAAHTPGTPAPTTSTATLAQATARPTPAPSAKPTAKTATPATTGPLAGERLVLDNKTLRAHLELPGSWNGESDQESGIVRLVSPSGLDIRVARDPSTLDPQSVFSAMRAEKWAQVGDSDLNKSVENTQRHFSATVLKKGGEQLVLVLLDQPDNSTLVLYCSREGSITEDNTRDIEGLVRQLAQQSERQNP